MRRAPAATPRMRPELRPRKLTRRSASPSGKVFKMMASVSRAGMKCRRDRLAGVRRISAQAGRTCRTNFNSIDGKVEQCARAGVVERRGRERVKITQRRRGAEIGGEEGEGEGEGDE